MEAPFRAWESLSAYFLELLDSKITRNDLQLEDLRALFVDLQQSQMDKLFIDWFFDTTSNLAQCSIGPAFWDCLKEFPNLQSELQNSNRKNQKSSAKARYQLDAWIVDSFSTAVQRTRKNCLVVEAAIEELYKIASPPSPPSSSSSLSLKDLANRWHFQLQSATFAHVPADFHTILERFFKRHWAQYTKLLNYDPWDDQDDDGDDDPSKLRLHLAKLNHDDHDDHDSEDEAATEHRLFLKTCFCLRQLQWTNFLCQQVYTDLVYAVVEAEIHKHCKGTWDRDFDKEILAFCSKVVLNWLRLILFPPRSHISLSSSAASSAASSSSSIPDMDTLYYSLQGVNVPPYLQVLNEFWRKRVVSIAYEKYTRLRVSELFDIIVDYPDSKRAVSSLGFYLKQTNLQSHLIESLSSQFRKRLLHPGATTSDIITQYISTVKTLRSLDPTGVTLQIAADPIRQYLAQRPDTKRCIITSLTGLDGRSSENNNTRSSKKGGIKLGLVSKKMISKKKNKNKTKQKSNTNNSGDSVNVDFDNAYHAEEDDDDDDGNNQDDVDEEEEEEEDGMGGELLEELECAPEATEVEHQHLEDLIEDYSVLESWLPEPKAIGINTSTHILSSAGSSRDANITRNADLISLLSSILNNNEQLMGEYKSLLSHELLMKFDYDIGVEINHIELLKIRFGEANLHHPEVMLKDFSNSRRINSNINSTMAHITQKQKEEKAEKDRKQNSGNNNTNNNTNDDDSAQPALDTTVISSEFWPGSLLDEDRHPKFNPPKAIKKLMKEYSRQYHKLKSPRELEWLYSLGLVDVSLELSDRVLHFILTPLQATIISRFDTETSCKDNDNNNNDDNDDDDDEKVNHKTSGIWQCDELAQAIGIPSSLLRKEMQFWLTHKVIHMILKPANSAAVSTQLDPYAIAPGKGERTYYCLIESLEDPLPTWSILQQHIIAQKEEEKGQAVQLSSSSSLSSSLSSSSTSSWSDIDNKSSAASRPSLSSLLSAPSQGSSSSTSSSSSSTPQQAPIEHYQQYILGLLSNFSSGISLSRLHMLLPSVRLDGYSPFEHTQAELRSFMAILIQSGQIRLSNGVYTRL